MAHTFDFDWLTTDKLKLVGKCWLPEVSPRALLCLVHGFGEHIGRYEHVATFFNKHQLGFLGFDLRGHGRSEGKRGVVPNYEALMENIGEFLALAQHKFTDLPLILYGHSMGGNLVMSYLLRFQPSVKAAIVTSPWLRLAKQPPFWRVLLARLVVQFYSEYTDKAELNPSDLSRDPSVGEAYQKDPLVHNQMSAMLFLGVENAGEQILQHANRLSIPLLLMHGRQDPITAWQASELFAKQTPSQTTFLSWDDARHELHNELNREDVLSAMLAWIDKQLT